MSLIRYGSYPLSSLQQQINRMFDQFDQTRDYPEGLGGGTFAPAMDVKETGDNYSVAVEVPGVKQDDIHIHLENNVLTISGSKQQTSESQGEEYRRVERSYGSFTRSITLPRNVDVSAVTTNLEDGVLIVNLPKSAEAKPRRINISTAEGSQNVTDLGSTANGHPETTKIEVQDGGPSGDSDNGAPGDESASGNTAAE